MAIAFGNTGSIGFANWVASGVFQSVSPFGWSRATADITPIDQQNEFFRKMAMSGRPKADDLTVTYFYDPTSAIPTAPTTAGDLTITYPAASNPTSTRVQKAFLQAYRDGGLIDDEIMTGEVTFVLEGGEAIDTVSA